jgi:hypothetical protein
MMLAAAAAPVGQALLAAVRPDRLDLPLFVHVAGAIALVGAAATAAVVALTTGTEAADWSRRLSFRLALVATLPAYIAMRVGAEWIRAAEFGDSTAGAGWIDLGYITADGGLLLLVVATVLVWLSARRRSARLAATAGVLLAVAVVAWVIAAWAMTAKPF